MNCPFGFGAPMICWNYDTLPYRFADFASKIGSVYFKINLRPPQSTESHIECGNRRRRLYLIMPHVAISVGSGLRRNFRWSQFGFEIRCFKRAGLWTILLFNGTAL